MHHKNGNNEKLNGLGLLKIRSILLLNCGFIPLNSREGKPSFPLTLLQGGSLKLEIENFIFTPFHYVKGKLLSPLKAVLIFTQTTNCNPYG